MIDEGTLNEIEIKIRLIKKTADELKNLAGDIPAVEKNTSRILASLKMLEINISDYMQLSE